ncbi:MAG TPA: hypothetical protein PLV25_08055, partial [Opitutales bacterium]|nr:hypothetical protein [Opitutales bacterium]
HWLKNFGWGHFDDENGKRFVDVAKKLGYDSVIFNDRHPDTGRTFESWALFHPNQLKSAIGNRGTFDPNNPVITMKDGGRTDDAFSKWFGKSKVVDAQGKPLTVYHGTRHDFSAFNAKSRNPQGRLHYFTEDPRVAAEYAEKGLGEGNTVMPVHLSFQNPFILNARGSLWSRLPLSLVPNYIKEHLPSDHIHQGRSTEEPRVMLDELTRAAQKAGHDSVIAKNIMDPAGSYGAKNVTNVYIASHPTQIKSAIGNRGTFDPNNPDITMAKGGLTKPQMLAHMYKDKLDGYLNGGVVHLAIGGQGPKNWMKDRVEKALEPLLQRHVSGDDPEEVLKEMERKYTPEALESMPNLNF